MNKIDEYNFYNILSFLQPYDLCKIRCLDRWSNKYTNRFLQKMIGTFQLEEFACPNCGSFIDNDQKIYKKVINDAYFYDIQYESIDRINYMKHNFNHYMPFHFFTPLIERCQLLCDDCDCQESEDVLCGKILFPRRGMRNYYLNIVTDSFGRNWTVLMNYEENNFIRWNEYKCFLPEDSDYNSYNDY